MSNKCKMIERKEGEKIEIVMKIMPADNVVKRIEKMQERGTNTEQVFKELEGIINEEVGHELLEVVSSSRGRNIKGEAWYEIEIRLSKRGERLSDKDVEYMTNWALRKYGKRIIDKKINYLPI